MVSWYYPKTKGSGLHTCSLRKAFCSWLFSVLKEFLVLHNIIQSTVPMAPGLNTRQH